MNPVAINEAKKVLRRDIKKRITTMSDELKLKESISIMNKLIGMEEYKLSRRISVYLSMPSEVQTEGILKVRNYNCLTNFLFVLLLGTTCDPAWCRIYSKQKSKYHKYLKKRLETNNIIDFVFRDCFVPRYIGSNMDMVKLDSMEDFFSLPLTSWNIRQPAENDEREEALLSGGLDLIVVPGLGFTKHGLRLGRGKVWLSALKFVMTFQLQKETWY
ncbi:5-formyltetrahydrofolate cyclo-ligase [Acropora cervicornis]|uniref:5-formyltetrahydrofolate cyclo-ligase n=1 Tax=Acropora cervicornis TaxID=6130 RepID=A0AAD9QPG6_ACRCE|nr:5-formyltetrahydrofolate cyclo-ligase [Acropora cervicornis]